MPALFTRMSISPHLARTVWISAPTSGPREISARIARPPNSFASFCAASSLRSAIATRAPSWAKRRAMPSPKPDAPPVTIATFPGSRSAMEGGHRFYPAEGIERFKAFFPAMAGAADAAERQFHTARRAVIVHEHLARPHRARQTHGATAIARPHPGDQPVGRAIGDLDRLVFGIERDH